MNDNKKKKIIIICSIILAIILFLVIYFLVNLNNKIKESIETDTFNYLTTSYVSDEYNLSYSPLIGLLNYNFDEISSNQFSILDLGYTNFLFHSIMNEDDLNSLYKSVLGKSKNEIYDSYDKSVLNCYYNEKKQGISLNCDVVCSKSENEIMSVMRNKLNWISISSEDVNDFCLKNINYVDNDLVGKTIIDINKLKSIFKEVTNKDLSIPSGIVNDELYKYNAYAISSIKRMDEYIIDIDSIEYKSRIGKKYTLKYVAKTNMNRDINGVVVLQNNGDKYFILSNLLETTLK